MSLIPPRPDGPQGLASASLEPIESRTLVSWRWWEGLLICLGAYFAGSIASLPLAALLKVGESGGAAGAGQLALTAAVDLVMLAVLVLWLNSAHKRWRVALGITSEFSWVKESVVGFGSGLVVYLVSALGAQLVVRVIDAVFPGGTGEPGLPDQISSNLSTYGIVALIFTAVIMAPITEEMVFRGIIFRGVRDKLSGVWGFVVGAGFSAVLFGLAHWVSDPDWRRSVSLQVTMVMVGFGLAWVHEWRKTMVANVAAHVGFNVIGVTLILASQARG